MHLITQSTDYKHKGSSASDLDPFALPTPFCGWFSIRVIHHVILIQVGDCKSVTKDYVDEILYIHSHLPNEMEQRN